MKIDYSKNLTSNMRSRKMALVPSGSIVCQSVQSAEVNDLNIDYLEFCNHLTDAGNTEIVPLEEFAKWRNEELLDSDGWVNPIPSIN